MGLCTESEIQDCEKKRRNSLPFLDVKLLKTSKHGSLCDKLLVLAKSMIFHDFHKMRHVLHLLDEKLPAHGTHAKKAPNPLVPCPHKRVLAV